MSKDLFLELGDIIKINASQNELLDSKIFYIDYLDNERMKLLNAETLVPYEINIFPGGNLSDETIESIEIYSKSKEKGYARLNNLLPETWVQINIGGDAAFIIIGKITNLDEDMIEIQEHPGNQIMYLDFGYKGVPLDIPDLKIKIRGAPKSFTPRRAEEEEEQEEEEAAAEDEEEEDDNVYVDDKLTGEELDEILFDPTANDDEDVLEIEQIVIVPEKQRRYDIRTQMTNMLDERLSVIPSKYRTKAVINELHTEIERFKQLRVTFSVLNSNGLPGAPLHHGETYKPLAKKLYELNESVHWIIPIVKNNKKLYDVDATEIDHDDNIVFLETTTVLTREKEIYQQFVDNSSRGEVNKYETLLHSFNPFFTPFVPIDEENSTLITTQVNDNYDVIVNNDTEFKTSVIFSPPIPLCGNRKKQDDNNLNRLQETQNYMDRYNTGLTHLNIKDIKKYDSLTNRIPLTNNDTIDLNGFLFLPKAVMNFSRLYLPETSILQRANMNCILFNYWSLLNSNIINTQYPVTAAPARIDTDFHYEPNTLLQQFIELTVDISLFDHIDHAAKQQRFEKFTKAIIPTTELIFKLMKADMKRPTSLIGVIKYLEPFAIYCEDIVYKQYVTIESFIKNNIVTLRRLYHINARACNRYSRTRSSKKDATKKFLSYIAPPILELYNISDKLIGFEDMLNAILRYDNGRYIFTTLSLEDIDLHSTTDIEQSAEESFARIEKDMNTNIKTNECKNYILTKVYLSMDQLIEDDDKSHIYYDKKYDPTRYSILDEFREQQGTLDETKFKNFLQTHFQTNVGMTFEDAEKEAVAMIKGKREITDGDYAIVEDDDVIHYYKRMKNKWKIDKTIEGNALDDTFCNLQDKCLKIKETCGDVKLNKSVINKDLLQQIGSQFDMTHNISKAELKQTLEQQLLLYEDKMEKLKWLYEENMLKYDKQKIGLIEQIFEERNASTIQTRLRDVILAQNDFVKKQTTIIKFVNNYCKTDPDTPYWFLCKETDMKLLPTFFYDLANAFFKKNYQKKLREVQQNRGTISDDEAKWVDKHSGYVISDIDYDAGEGYTEDGFKQVSRDIMEESLGDAIVKQTVQVEKKFVNDIMRKIYNIVMAMAEFIGVTMDTEYDYIANQVTRHMDMLPTDQQYTAQIKTLKKRKTKKKFQSYKIYRDTALLLYTLGYFLISLQTKIPTASTRVRYPGCKKALKGYPCDGSKDFSALKYITCIVQKVSKNIDVWKVLAKQKEKTIESNLKKKIDEIMKVNDTVKQKIKLKKAYLALNPDKDEIPYSHDIRRWNTFLPPLCLDQVKRPKNLGAQFKKELLSSIRSGSSLQFNQISILLGKMIFLSLSIQTIIQNILHKQQPLLANAADVPYLENNCCNEGIKNTYNFLTDQNSSIDNINKEVIKLSKIYTNVKNFFRGWLLYDDVDTHPSYPELIYDFNEETIFRAFIFYCKLDSMVPAHPSLDTICIDKDTSITLTDSFEEKVTKLKDAGKQFTKKGLTNLLKVVGRENYIDIDFTRTVIAKREQLRVVLESMRDKNGNEFQMFIEKLLTNDDTFHSVENQQNYNTGPADDLRNFIAEKVAEKRETVVAFLDFFRSFCLTKKNYTKITTFLENTRNWRLRGEGEHMYMKKTDETFFYSGNFLKDITTAMCDMYPLMIKHNVEYSTQIPKQWGLSQRHENLARILVTDEYTALKPFYRDARLISFLTDLKRETENIRILMRYIPFMADFGNKRSIFDGKIYEEIMEYLFFTVLCKYTSSGDRLIIRQGDSSAEEEGESQSLNQTICGLLIVYINFFQVKKTMLNVNNEDIKEKILKQKEREKENMLRRGALFSIEEQKAEKELKRHKLGVWSKGLTKTLFKYSADEWDVEYAEIEHTAQMEHRMGQHDEVTDSLRGILRIDLEERDNTNTRLDRENYGIAKVLSSEDGDGDEDF